MTTNTINLNLYSDSYNAKNVEAICGKYKVDVTTKQVATYSIENGLATIHSLTPVFGTVVSLPLPFVVPVRDLGSGLLKDVEIDVDTFRALESICIRPEWAERLMQQPVLTIQQTLWADYNGLH